MNIVTQHDGNHTKRGATKRSPGRSVHLLLVAGLLGSAGWGCRAPERGPVDSPGAAVSSEAAGDPMTAVDTLFPAPADFALQRIDTEAYPVPTYAKYLAGVRICVDPGHGGDADKRGYKRGPTGVREAEVNLRVAQYLRDFLEHVGAEVRLTRSEDVDLSLEARANLANDWSADLFVSCHHNAIGKSEPNYTTVWYHDGIDARPANLDLARHLCQGLLDSPALAQYATVPLKSDEMMYPEGFAVLRHARVTACLVEISFFTNPEEEQRLRDPEYNLAEAYGLFLGFARYAAEGLPRAELIAPADGVLAAGAPAVVTFTLSDGLRVRKAWGHERQMVFTDSIVVRVDGAVVAHRFRNEDYALEFDAPADLAPGEHSVEVQFQNMYKNSVLNPQFTLEVR